VLAEIVQRAIQRYKDGEQIRLTAIKQAVCAELKYTGRVPKTVEILAAVPQKYSFLVPLLKVRFFFFCLSFCLMSHVFSPG
jgi:hypothetical protein